MKTLKAFLLALFFLPLLFGCSAKFTIPENASIDANFIGKWEGKHFDEKSGYLKKWVQTRKGDGTYTIHLKFFDKNDKFLSESAETGYWWIKSDLFHEISPSSMKKPESYRFQLMGKDKIKFSSVKAKADYSFIDIRVSK
ncbi:MAG: hypothetical protein ABFS39_05080 [Pseudomonadota bacterium]